MVAEKEVGGGEGEIETRDLEFYSSLQGHDPNNLTSFH